MRQAVTVGILNPHTLAGQAGPTDSSADVSRLELSLASGYHILPNDLVGERDVKPKVRPSAGSRAYGTEASMTGVYARMTTKYRQRLRAWSIAAAPYSEAFC